MFKSLPVEWNKSFRKKTLQDSAQLRRHCVTCFVWTGAYMCIAISQNNET